MREVLVLASVFAFFAFGAAAGDKSKPADKAKPQAPADLVWPGPPSQPRIRFVAAILGSEDVTGKVKQSLSERLAGRSPTRDSMTLQKPYGIAIDKNGRVFLADAQRRAILIFDRTAKATAQWRGNAQFPLVLPIGLAFAADGRLFVSDSYAAQVVVFDPEGKPVAGFGKGTMQRPGGLAMDSKRGRCYVVDTKRNEVLVFDAQSFKLLKTIGVHGKPDDFGPGVFSAPTNAALDSKGNLYITDTWNCRVQVFDSEGKFVRMFGQQGVRPGNFIRPKGIAIDSEDHVYVVDANFNNFQILTTEGKPLLFVGSYGDQPGEFLLPAGVAIDREDRIYITEQRVDNGRLQIFQFLPDKRAQTGRGE